jgi:AcrR family transcriptional regulator
MGKLGMSGTAPGRAADAEHRILVATKQCCERYGIEKVTIDDIAAASGVSRASIYRMFPGGKDVVLEALRVRELEDFFAVLTAQVAGLDNIEDLLVRTVVVATQELRADEHLAMMLASEPGVVLSQLTVDGLPRIVRFATAFLAPLAEPFLGRARSRAVIDVLARLTISYFLAPSDTIDLGDDESARSLLRPFLQPFLIETFDETFDESHPPTAAAPRPRGAAPAPPSITTTGASS